MKKYKEEKIIKKRLVEIIEDSGIGYTEFAEKIGVNQSYLSLIKTGRCTLSEKVATKIKDIYKISPAWLLYNVGNKYDDSDVIHVSDRLITILNEIPFTPKMFAEFIGIDPKLVNQWKKDSGFITYDMCKRIEELFGYSPYWIMYNVGEKISNKNPKFSYHLDGRYSQELRYSKLCTNRISLILRILGTTIPEFAKNVGCSNSHIYNLYAGKKTVTARVAMKIESVYSISSIWLIYGVGEIFSTNHNTLTERMYKILVDLNMSHEELSEALHISRGTLTQYIHLRRPMNNKVAELICSKYGYDYNWLMNGNE